MSKFNTFIKNRNFIKIFIVYLIITILSGIFCSASVGYIFKDKIILAWQYEQAREGFDKDNNDNSKIKSGIEALSNSSNDIVDVLLLDNENNILLSTKNTKLAWDNKFELEKSRNSNKFLVSDTNTDIAFRFVKKDEFMLSTALANDFKEIHDEYDEENFYLNNFTNKKLYLISLLGSSKDGTKAYVICNPSTTPYGMLALKISASIGMLLFMIYWVIVALWVYQNALKSNLSAPVWGIITLFTNLAGVLVYVIYKHINGICEFCGTIQPKTNVFCTYCGKKIGVTCDECGHSLKSSDNFCPKCGHKVH